MAVPQERPRGDSSELGRGLKDECAQSPKQTAGQASQSSARNRRTPSCSKFIRWFSVFEAVFIEGAAGREAAAFLSGRRHGPAELFRGGPAGLPAPQVDEKLARQGDDGALAPAFVSGRIEQHVAPPLHGRALRLVEHPAPGRLDQHGAQAPVARFGNRQILDLVRGPTDPTAQPGNEFTEKTLLTRSFAVW